MGKIKMPDSRRKMKNIFASATGIAFNKGKA